MEEIELVDLEFEGTMAKNEVTTVCKTILAILADDVDISALDTSRATWSSNLNGQNHILLQEDVQTFQDSIGKAEVNLLVNMSTYVSRSQFLMTKLEAYMKDAEGVLKHGSQVEDALAVIPGLTLCKESLEMLNQYLSCVPQWQDSLRPALHSQLANLLLEKLKELSQHLLQSQVDANTIGTMVQVLSEAAIVWPLEADIPMLKEEVGLALGEATIYDTMQAVEASCASISHNMHPDNPDEVVIEGALQHMSEMKVNAPFPPQRLTETTKMILERGEKDIIKYFLFKFTKHSSEAVYDSKQFQTFSASLTYLSMGRGQNAGDVLAVLEAAVQLQDASVKRLKANAEQLESQSFAERRACLKLKHVLEATSNAPLLEVKPDMLTIVQKHEKEVMAAAAPIKEKALNELKSKLDENKGLVEKGENFFGMKKQSVEKTMKIAEEQLLEGVDPSLCLAMEKQLAEVRNGERASM
eukprot:2934459-Amphidinium_carterae.2